ncbi:MAG: reprolysin-like metallopeptidase [Saprospiraceae bacterium]
MKSLYLLFSFCLLLASTISAQSTSSPWTEVNETDLLIADSKPERIITPNSYKTLRLDATALQRILTSAPSEESIGNKASDPFEVLLPSGKTEAFHVVEYSMMEPALAAQFPNIKTYHGYGVDDPSRKIRLDWTSQGVNAMLQLSEGLAFIKPYAKGDTENYLTYYERDLPADTEPFDCTALGDTEAEPVQGKDLARAGDCQLRTYRLAVATTAEYSTVVLGASTAGTAADEMIVMNHVVTSINQINGFYERDITTRWILIDNLTDIFYFDGASDPYTNGTSTTMLGENISNLGVVIGNENFDLGHVLGSSGGTGGVAGVNVLCGNSKARGVTQSSSNGINTPRFLKVWSHEMGHQCGAGHTQNEDCQRSSASAMEPGAGTTIMSYVTSNCANQIQNVPDYYFHSISVQQMSARMLSTDCATIIASANTAPTVSAGMDQTVPSSTPLRLNADASDPDNDPMTFTWEQFDNDVATAIPPQPTNTLGPNFRSLPPRLRSDRFLPNLAAVIDGTTPRWEVIPSVAREMEFRVTARDNSTNSISCTAEDNIVITTVAGGPFEVITASSAGTIWFEGETQTVSWDVAGTDAAPVSCANVDILLSYDGGETFPATLATGVANTGSASVTVPTGITTTARLIVSCSDNIFYNVSESDFEIKIATGPTFTLTLPNPTATICPGEIAEFPIATSSIAGFTGDITLEVANLPGASAAAFGTQIVAAGTGTTVSISNTAGLAGGDYTLTVTGANGAVVRNSNLVLTVLEPAGTATLATPLDEALDVPLSPVLSWALKPNATSYDVQVSTNRSFTNIFVDKTVMSNSISMPSALREITTYYWRVRATTLCGVTPFTSRRSFTTANCIAPVTQSDPVAISESGTPSVTSVITMNRPGLVSEISISNITGTHTYMQDLTFTLIGPGGSPEATLWSGLCGADNDFNLSISDDAVVPVSDAPCIPLGQGGTFRPESSLAVFRGIDIAGEWTLRISDGADADGGMLESWSLDFCETSRSGPDELPAFQTEAIGNVIQFDLRAPIKDHSVGIEIERRSANESEFKTIKKVVSAHDIQQLNNHGYLDASVEQGVRYYYRLRQNHLNGNAEYSVVRSASLTSALKGMQVYPNPVKGELSGLLDIEANIRTDLTLLDLNGRVVLAQTATGTQFTMNLDNLPAGIYVLKAKHVNGEEIVKLVVE